MQQTDVYFVIICLCTLDSCYINIILYFILQITLLNTGGSCLSRTAVKPDIC